MALFDNLSDPFGAYASDKWQRHLRCCFGWPFWRLLSHKDRLGGAQTTKVAILEPKDSQMNFSSLPRGRPKDPLSSGETRFLLG